MEKIQLKYWIIPLLLVLGINFPIMSEEKILIFTYRYNRPDFIEIQHKTFKKFLKDDYNPLQASVEDKAADELTVVCLYK